MTSFTRFTRHVLPVIAISMIAQQGGAQGGTQPATMINQSTDPLLKNFRFRSIGPASMGGRIDDVEVSLSNPNIIYIGYATSGIWKSVNNGTTFEPVFDTYEVSGFGDLAIHPTNPDIVYAGTGESNNRQSSSYGAGIYKTTDGGKTWRMMGLRETLNISRVVLDPRNPETVYVAANGALFGPNEDRGVYKSTNGGQSWTKVKYVDENTGFTDIVIDPSNPQVLYAASYQRRRTNCCFNGGGPGSALWKTTNGGQTWTKLTGNGLPPGTYGRIALAISQSQPNIVMAQIEAGETGQVIQPGQGRGGGGGGFGGGGGYNWCNNAGPGGGFAAGGGGGGRAGQPAAPQTAPALSPAQGGIFKSTNSGGSWTLVSNCNARPMYFSQIRIDPSNPNNVYVAGLPIAKSLDGGRTFATLDEAGGHGEPGHVDVHAIWINPRNSNHIMNGNDGGLDISYDQGKNWISVKTMAAGYFYAISYDMRRPYWVCGGLQDNGSWCGPSSKRANVGILNSDWFRIGGGDGFFTAQDANDYNIVYAESQNGNTNRIDLRTGRGGSIRASAPPPPPQVDVPSAAGRGGAGGGGGGGGGGRGGTPNVVNGAPGEQYRYNWNTPYYLSKHNQSVVILGGNRVFKSYDRGETWFASADLTKQYDRNTANLMGQAGNTVMLSKNDGFSNYSTVITVSESPVTPAIIWAGTDDGNVQVTRDNMTTFTNVTANLPGLPAGHMYWISRVVASAHDSARAYVAVDGHRNNDNKPYAFMTNDFGRTFVNISNNLPPFGHLNTIAEDPKNPDLLFIGTEFGLYISMNRGQSWQKFMNNYPTVRTDDIRVHPRDGDLIVGSHGRSIYIADDITPLQQMTQAVMNADAHLFDIRPAVAWIQDRKLLQQVTGQMVFQGENAPPGTSINYHLKAAVAGPVRITIADISGRTIRELEGPGAAGINRVQWNLQPTPVAGQGGRGGGGGGGGGAGMVAPGTYRVTLTVGGQTLTKMVEVLEDRWMEER